jgi:hypothetical protein
MLGMADRFTLRQVDARSFELHVHDDRYFSGLLGRFLIDAMRTGGPLRTGDRIDADGYTVTVLDGAAAGVRALRFTFDRPLSDPAYRFCVGSSAHQMGTVRFAAQPLASGAANRHNASLPADRAMIKHVARAIGAPLLETIEQRKWSADDRRRIARWWSDTLAADPKIVERFWNRRAELADIRTDRTRFFAILDITRAVVQSDMYLTGPPYPGPRPRQEREGGENAP